MKRIKFDSANLLVSDVEWGMLEARFNLKNAKLEDGFWIIRQACICSLYRYCEKCPFFAYDEGSYGRSGCSVIIEDYIFKGKKIYFDRRRAFLLKWSRYDNRKVRRQIRKIHKILMSAKDEKK